MPQLTEIESRAKAFADARSKLSEYVDALNQALESLRRDNLPRIKRQLVRAAELQTQLKEMVAESPDLFVKPKTVVLHGIKVGFEKGKGAIVFDDADQVVTLIDKKLPDLADVLIATTKKPVKAGLAQLTVAQLKSIGCSVEEAGDRVVVRAVDSEVDKLVTALLKGATEEQEG